MTSDYCVGIDLGTTNSLCSIWQQGRPEPQVLPITQPYDDLSLTGLRREALLPSAVALGSDGVFVGFAARQLGRLGRSTVITSIKRHMGTHWCRHIEGRTWTPEAISGCILKAVRREIEMTFQGPPQQVVITVPASFGTEGRRATLMAARLAGFETRTTRLFDEPAAALLQQWQTQRETLQSRLPQRLMMIDIGGGTFDVSLLELRREEDELIADIQGRSRYNELAGDDFDLNIAGLLLARYESERRRIDDESHPVRRTLFYEMLLRAEEAKKQLSLSARDKSRDEFDSVREPLTIHYTPDNDPWRTELSLRDLTEVLQQFFPFSDNEDERRQEFSFFKPIQQCLDSVAEITGKNLSFDDVDAVYLAGGSSLLPMVPSAVQRIMCQRPQIVADPMQAVALGAAWYAGMLQGYTSHPIILRERLFDGLYLQTDSGSFVQLLSPQEQVPLAERLLDQVISVSQHDRRIEVALYMGSGPDDPNMVPLARRRVDFGTLLPQGHPIRMTVSVSKNRQVEFTFSTEFHGQTLQGRLEISAALGWEHDGELESPLPEVNRPVPGGKS